ncbi:MAG: ATP-binding protein [Desulfobacterales bacterium]
MRIRQTEKLYLPALSIVAVVLLLLVLISISTYRNLNRDRKKAIDSFHRHALTLIQTLEAGARAGMKRQTQPYDLISGLVQETGKIEEISYLYLLDSFGKIVYHSGSLPDGLKQDQISLSGEKTVAETASGHIRKLLDGTRIYELRKQFSPLRSPSADGSYDSPAMQIVVALKLKAFDDARRTDLHHAVFMAAIIVALGSGALFFIFVIQNYYLVNRTLRQTQDYTRLVIDHMANGLLSIDAEGNIVSYNKLALEILRVEESGVLGMSLEKIIDFQASGITETLTNCQIVLEREILLPLEAGKTIPLSVSVTPILRESGLCRGAVIVLRDLSEIKRLEEKVRRAERFAAVGKLAAGVAHEIRNPLSSIKGLAQFLGGMANEKPENKKFVDTIVAEVDRINRVVTDLLLLARPFRAELKPVDVMGLIDHAVLLIQSDSTAGNILIQTDYGEGLHRVPLDASQMTQALLNLLLNSIQAEAAGGRIEVGARVDSQNTFLQLWVEDNGPGISQKDRENIFDPFFTTRESGTGIGLAIVNKIVQNHDGEIQIQSPVPGKERGCRVLITIPIDVNNS